MTYLDKKTEEKLKDLIESESFWVALKKEKEAIAKLNGDYKSIEENRHFKNTKAHKRFWQARDNLLKNFKLNKRFAELIEDYLIYGKIYDSKSRVPALTIYGASISPNLLNVSPGKATLYIYPGASIKAVQSLLRSWWPRIDRNFRITFPEEYKHRAKTKTKRNRDQRIFELRKLKLFKSDGSPNHSAIEKYYGIETLDKLKTQNYYKQIISDREGIELPKSNNTIRNIIAKIQKRKK